MTETVDFKEQIYIEYHKKVAGYIHTKVSDPHETEDLTSCVFLKVYQRLDGFDETKASLSTWIFTITKNTVIDYFRTRKVNCEFCDDIFYGSEIDTGLLREEVLEELACALEKLDERERDLIILHYYGGQTLKQIALRMGMSYANTKIVHNKALCTLRRHINRAF